MNTGVLDKGLTLTSILEDYQNKVYEEIIQQGGSALRWEVGSPTGCAMVYGKDARIYRVLLPNAMVTDTRLVSSHWPGWFTAREDGTRPAIIHHRRKIVENRRPRQGLR